VGKERMLLAISKIRTDGGTQSRDSLNEATVAEYAEAMKDGVEFPPIITFHDGSHHWLADGFHRVMAANTAGVTGLSAMVHKGTRRDAVLYSVGANASHGLRRTNADKRLSVTLLLQDEEWAQWSDREIARRCAVGHHLVASVRSSLGESPSEKPRTYTTKHGTEATMRTENIGKILGSNEPLPSYWGRPDHVERDGILPPASTPRPIAQSRGIGLGYAHQAIACLQKIPSDDGLRNEALDEVVRWIKHNR